VSIYTVDMALRGVSVSDYFNTKVRLAKEADIMSEYQQLLAVWNGLDVSIRAVVDEPDELTTHSKFRQRLDAKEMIWRERILVSQSPRAGRGGYGRGANQYQQPGYQSSQPYFNSNYQGPQQQFGGLQQSGGLDSRTPWNRGQSFNQRTWTPQATRPAVQTSPPRLQITNGQQPAQLPQNPNQSTQSRPLQSTQTSPLNKFPNNQSRPYQQNTISFRRQCGKCGGNHMSWEHDFLSANPGISRPPKAFYVQALTSGLSNEDDVAYCLETYHAICREENGGQEPYQQEPDQQQEEQQDPTAFFGLTDPIPYPEVGGSNWFRNSATPPDDLNNPQYQVPFFFAASSTSGELSAPPMTEPEPPLFKCRQCESTFKSRNRLFNHIKEKEHYKAQPEVGDARAPEIRSPPSHAPSASGLAFLGYSYAQIQVQTELEEPLHVVCADTGCVMMAVDEDWLVAVYPKCQISTMSQPVQVNGIGGSTHVSQCYTVIKVYIPGEDTQTAKPVTAALDMEVHLVKGLGCRLLIGCDVLDPYKAVIDFDKQQLAIRSCNIATPITVKKKNQPSIVNRKVKTARRTVIPPCSQGVIPVKFKPLGGVERNLDFIPKYSGPSAFLAMSGAFLESVFSNKTDFVLYHNKSDHAVIVNKNTVLGSLTDFHPTTDCRLLSPEEAYSTISRFPVAKAERFVNPADPEWKRVADALYAQQYTATSFQGIGDFIPKSTQEHIEDAVGSSILDDSLGDQRPISSFIDDIRISPTLPEGQKQRLKAVVTQFRSVFERTDGTVDEPEDNWLKIKIKEGAEVPKPKGVYRLGKKDREVVDRLFDRLRREGKMSRSAGSPYGWGVFVVWNRNDPNDKGRVVVDTRGLNAITEDDNYPLPYQEDLLHFVKGKGFIALMDAIKSYYQRNSHPSSWPYQTVHTHRGAEQFNVLMMGFKGSVAHQQRFMEELMEEFDFVMVYIDDILIASDTFEEHIEHIAAVLDKLERVNLALNPAKCSLGFERIKVLGHLVDQYGLATLEAKTAAIREMEYPTTLAQLDYFLGLTGYYRQYVAWYAQKARPLKNLKTFRLRDSPRKDKKVTASIKLGIPTAEQLQSFTTLKADFSSELFLIHDDDSVPLQVAVDAAYEFGFGAVVYQVPIVSMKEHGLTIEDVVNGRYDRRLERVVMFLSREISPAESRYWPTELETAGVVFAVQKARHLIESNRHPTLIYTDHVAVQHISHSKSLKTRSPERSNLRLIRAAQYLSQFRLRVQYRPGCDNIPADALSRLRRITPTVVEQNIYLLENDVIPEEPLAEGVEMTIHATEEFLIRWSAELVKDRHLSSVYNRLATKLSPDIDSIEEQGWVLKRKEARYTLLYLRREDGLRACVPESLAKELLKVAHDKMGHPSIEKTYANLHKHVYMRQMSSLVRKYVSACPECIKKKTLRHPTYGTLQPIEPPMNPFDLITIDFVVKLPPSKKNGETYDTVLSATDKMSRSVILTPGKETWNATEWAGAFFDSVVRRWGLPHTIISDRGSIFTSELWRGVFNRYKVDLLLSTSYHPQTDGQSEAMNQNLQTLLRFFVNQRQDDWVDYLPEVEMVINNSPNASTKISPNEIVLGFPLRTPLSVLGDTLGSTSGSQATREFDRDAARKEARDATKYAAFQMARHYNRKHKEINLEVGSKVYIHLGSGYSL